MNSDQRTQLRQLIEEWYQLIVDGKPGAAVAAKKLAALANAHPKDYVAVAQQALLEAGLGADKQADANQKTG